MKNFTYFIVAACLLLSYQLAYTQASDSYNCGQPLVGNLTDYAETVVSGTVTVGNDDSTLYITYNADENWAIFSALIYVGPEADIPPSSSGTPGSYDPGAFPYQKYWSVSGPGVTSYTRAIDKYDENGDLVFPDGCFAVVAYSNVRDLLGIPGSNNYIVWGKSEYKASGHILEYCWQDCPPQAIEVVGMGVHTTSISTLTFPGIENIDHVVVEAVYKGAPWSLNGVDKGPVEFSNNMGDVQLAYPVFDILDYQEDGTGLPLTSVRKLFFTATFNSVDADLGITLDQLNNFGEVHSLIAYVYHYMPDAIYQSVMDEQHVFFYKNNEHELACDPINKPNQIPIGAYYTEIDIPTSELSRDISITVPISEMANDARNGFIEAWAGTSTPVIHEFNNYDLGNSLRIESLHLTNVSGNEDKVSVKIWSPCEYDDPPSSGDSFITSGIVLDITDKEEEDCYPCEGQMSFLELEYLGSENNVTIKVYSKKVEEDKLIGTFPGLSAGDAFSFYGNGTDNKMGSKIRITINGENDDYTEIHTSCSQVIGVGMVYANKAGTENKFKILAGESAEGGPICEEGGVGGELPCGPCDGQMTALTLKYMGAESDVTIKVYKDKVKDDKILATFTGMNTGNEFSFVGVGNDNKLGAKIRITIDDEDDNFTEIHTSCSDPIGVGMIYDNLYEIIAGTSKDGGPLCEDGGGNPGGDPDDDCGPCDGQMTSLTLRYQGNLANAEIKAYKDKVQNKKLLATFTGIDNGDEISFIGVGKHKKLGAKVRLTINGEEDNYTEIHTSCSKAIEVGMVYSDKDETTENFLLLAGISRNGGPLCEDGTKSGSVDDYYDMISFDESDDEYIETRFKIYPNPMKTYSNVEFVVGQTGDVTVELISFYGNTIKELYKGNTVAGAKYVIKVDGQDLPRGMYFIRMINGSDVKQDKLQVVR